MTDEQLNKLVQAIDRNTNSINLLATACSELFESISDNEGEEKDVAQYLSGDSID